MPDPACCTYDLADVVHLHATSPYGRGLPGLPGHVERLVADHGSVLVRTAAAVLLLELAAAPAPALRPFVLTAVHVVEQWAPPTHVPGTPAAAAALRHVAAHHPAGADDDEVVSSPAAVRTLLARVGSGQGSGLADDELVAGAVALVIAQWLVTLPAQHEHRRIDVAWADGVHAGLRELAPTVAHVYARLRRVM